MYRSKQSLFLKKALIFLLTIALLLPLCPATVLADGKNSEVTIMTETFINPLYEDVIDISDLNEPSDNPVSTYKASEYYTSIEEAGAYMRSQMKQRSETIEVGLQYEISDEDADKDEVKEIIKNLAQSIVSKALTHTGEPTEGDYLLWQYGGGKYDFGYSNSDNIYYITYTYTITYYTTAEQESELDAALAGVMEQLDLDHKTDYEKMKSIYDYICDNITYDHEHLEDDDYKLKYTAYAALINKTAVCQGYAVLLYRMALEAGIDARLIAGKANNDNHGWNIAQMEGYYYNLDATWDAGETTYDYFLRCNDNFSGHTRNEDYATDEFNRQYPMGTEDYQPSNEEPVEKNPFVDVSKDDYYYDAVLWAYKNGIVSGKDNTHFAPSDPCTRAQSAAFLWRANNEPEPVKTENPFVDINPSDYYYKAVLWAYENNITSGKDTTHFQPGDTVTRKEFVTFLWRSAGKPEPKMTENPFGDVPDGKYYTKAVLWAYENNITKGKDDTHFQPDGQCIRAQVVSFLYRFYN